MKICIIVFVNIISLLIIVTNPVFSPISFLHKEAIAEECRIEDSEDELLAGFRNNLHLFAFSFQKQLDYEKLSEQLQEVNSFITFNGEDVQKIVQIGRNQGIFLNAFKIQEKDLINLVPPLFVFLKDEGYVLVIDISEDEVKYIDLHRIVKLLSKQEFLDKWNRIVISLPLVNVKAKRFCFDGNNTKKGEFVVIYMYHDDEFSKIEPALNKLLERTKRDNKKLIYVDELGLIPKETVEGRMKRLNISEEKAFEQIKQSIFEENEMLERGIPLNIGSKLYRKLYRWFARHRIKSLVEDLDYNLWQKIVQFDENEFYSQAVNWFILGYFDKLILTMTQFVHGFWAYNIALRDEKFRIQIEHLMDIYTDALIFTIRGSVHYGMEEKLKNNNFTVETLFIGESPFEDNFVAQQLLRVYDSNNVSISKQRRALYLLQSIPQEILRQFFYAQNRDLKYSTKISKQIINRMSFFDLNNLSLALRTMIENKKISGHISAQELGEFAYNWVKEYGFVEDNNSFN